MRVKFVLISALFLIFFASFAPLRAAAQPPALGTIRLLAGSPDSGGGDVGQYSSYKIDPLGGQHVSYLDTTHGRLKYASRPNPTRPWRLEVVDQNGKVGRYSDLAISSATTTSTLVRAMTGSTTVTRVSGPGFSTRYESGTIAVAPYAVTYSVAGVPNGDTLQLALPFADASTTGTATLIYYQPVIAYQDFSTTASLKVARPGAAGGWTLQTVDSSAFSDETTHTLLVGYDASVAVDDSQHIHVAYQDRTPDGSTVGELRYAYYNGTQWTRRIIDSLPGAGYGATIEVGNDAKPVIFQYNQDDHLLRYSTPITPGPDWLTYFIVSEEAGIGLSSARFEEGDRIFAGFNRVFGTGSTPQDLVVANSNPNKLLHLFWDREVATSRAEPAPYTAVALGQTTGTQALVFYNAEERNLKASVRGTSAFSAPFTMDMGGDVGRFCSADYDPVSGNMSAAYYDAGHEALKLSLYDGATTATQFIDGLKAGTFSSIAQDATDIYVAYHHDSQGSLHLAQWRRGAPPSSGTDIVLDNSTADVGEYCSMAIDSHDRIFIAYYDRIHNSLRLASRVDDGTWHFSEFFIGQGGQYCKLRISPSENRIAIMFNQGDSVSIISSALPVFGAPSFNLLFGTDMQRGGNLGRFGDFTYDAAGQFHAIYYNDLELRPEYSYGGNGQFFVHETIEDNVFDVIGWYNAIAIDPVTQRAVVSYYAASEGALHYAERQDDGTWDVTVLDTTGATGLYSKIVYDPVREFEYIFYYSQSLQDLKMVYRPMGAPIWRPEVILAEGGKGVRPDASLSDDGVVQLSFYDEEGGDLLTSAMPPATGLTNAARPEWTQYR